MSITVVGSGYVGLSLAVLIARKYNVKILDIDKKRVDLINKKISPIKDKEIKDYLKNEKLNLIATTFPQEAYKNAEFIIIATPTNYDMDSGSFDTSSVEQVIKDSRSINQKSTIVIKSTVPLGFTDRMRGMINPQNIFFSPEFLRESKALHDNLYPSRVIVGDNSKKAKKFLKIIVHCAQRKKSEISCILMKSKEAEAVKLFSNSYLAMRVAFFNELDSFAETYKISTENIIKGVCEDPRIGHFYNNPSFGYGGYCLPKDTKQLLKNFNDIPSKLIKAIVESNQTRKKFIVDSILKRKPKSIGVYRLIMKSKSDNFRESAVIDIIKILARKNINIYIYEPLAKSELNIRNTKLENDIKKFVSKCDLIIANRKNKELKKLSSKVYSRDIFAVD